MDAFEDTVRYLLEQDGYWVRDSFKVELTPREKRHIGKHSSPRWEIDLVAYNASANEILAIECKSFLDSKGVLWEGVGGGSQEGAKRYKLFDDPRLRTTVLRALLRQMEGAGLCMKGTTVRLCLAAGKIASETDHDKIKKHFERKGWKLLDRHWFRERFKKAARSRYEDNVGAVVAKMILRDRELLQEVLNDLARPRAKRRQCGLEEAYSG